MTFIKRQVPNKVQLMLRNYFWTYMNKIFSINICHSIVLLMFAVILFIIDINIIFC